MTFYERYTHACKKQGIDPCSQSTADKFNVTRSTISSWGTKNVDPKGVTVAKIADALNVSTDYLLGRTDDMTDHTILETQIQLIANENPPEVLKRYAMLDDVDQAKVDGVIQGLLLNDKYRKKQSLA